MFDFIGIGDPVIDTHVQIDKTTKEIELKEATGRKRLCLEYGAKIPITDSFQTLGGNAANTIVALTKFGHSCAFVSTIGDDSNGQLVIDNFKKFKVDTSLITKQAGADTRYSIILNYLGERTILSYSEKKSYIWPEPVPETAWIFYSGLSAGFETIQDNLILYLDAHPTVRLAINPGSYMIKFALEELLATIARADILLVNLEEAEKILNKQLTKEKSRQALINELLALGVKEVVLTDGAAGAWAGDKEEAWQLEAFPIKVVAKTGAGDAFSAGYLAARHVGHDIPHALEWGAANSASVIQAHGPHAGLLNKAGLEKILEKFSSIKPKQIS